MEFGTPNAYEIKTFKKDLILYKKITILLLSFHVYFLVLALLTGFNYIVIINVFSILFYSIAFPLLKGSKKNIIIYSHLIISEIMLHIFLCTLILGWESGYQYWLFSLLCSYLFPYITPDRTKKDSVKDAIKRTMVMFIEFVVLYIFTHYFEFPFTNELSKTGKTVLSIGNAFTALGAIAIFTVAYTRQMEYKYSVLHNVADSDQLTGLGNRYYMNDLLVKLERNNAENTSYSVAMLDIDFFKNVNDSYGHDKGDMVLKGIASILTKNSSDNIKAGRWGGEEFLLIADGEVEFSEFILILEKIRHEVLNTVFAFTDEKPPKPIKCTISVGVAKYEENLSIPEVIKLADTNLYKAKQNGRNQIIY